MANFKDSDPMDKIQLKVKRQYNNKKNSDIVNVPVQFRQTALLLSENPELSNAPIASFRILFKILNNISNDQFQPKKQKVQYSLFEEDFKTEHNTYARFTFKVTEIDESRNYKAIKKGLEFLEQSYKGWHSSTSSKGKPIKSYGGLISNPNISEGEISFFVSSYWMEKFLDIPSYNQAYFMIPWVLSKGRQMLFYLWLLEIPERGTKVDFNKFQKHYGYNYGDAQVLVKNVLKPLKNKLDRYSNKSFNYSTKGNIISIIPYYTKDVEPRLNNKTITKQKITQKLHYWKIRHSLSTNSIGTIKSLINLDPSIFPMLEKSYLNFINERKKLKEKATNYTGIKFLQIFQEEIRKTYENSIWKDVDKTGYPKII